jgi:uncharacterized protein GlcG (DUF336 family)
MSALTLKQANTIIEQAIAKARQDKIKPLTVVVLDDSGNVVAVQREDGASMARYDIALGKAWGAVAMSCSSRALPTRDREGRMVSEDWVPPTPTSLCRAEQAAQRDVVALANNPGSLSSEYRPWNLPQ